MGIEGVREMVNFLIYYELDQDTVKTPLRLADYGGSDEDAWVLIEPSDGGQSAAVEGTVGPSGAADDA